jgi:hypothetical protein
MTFITLGSNPNCSGNTEEGKGDKKKDKNTTPKAQVATSSSAEVSTSSLPSLDHNRLEYPQPHPTRMSFSRSQKDKGKAKAVSNNEDVGIRSTITPGILPKMPKIVKLVKKTIR